MVNIGKQDCNTVSWEMEDENSSAAISLQVFDL